MAAVARPQRARQLPFGAAEQQQPTTLDQPDARGTTIEGVDDSERRDHRRRIDVAAAGLVVEADVATDHRQVEGPTGLAHPVDRLRQLPHHLGVLGVAEVEAVDEGEGAGADRRQVHDRLDNGGSGTHTRIDRAPTVVAVGRERQAPAGVEPGEGVLQTKHCGVAAGCLHGVEEQLVVVLRRDPRRVAEHRQQIGGEIAGVERVRGIGAAGVEVGRRGERTVVERRRLVQRRGRQIADHHVVGGGFGAVAIEEPQRAALGHGADHRGQHLPALTDRQHIGEVGRLDDREHPLLGLRRHDLVGLHARLTLWHGPDVDVHAHTAARCRLRRGAREPGAAEILDADHVAGVEQREARLDEPLLLVGVADLDRRALGGVGLVVAEAGGREDRHTTDAVATGGGPEEDGEVADTRRLAEHQSVVGEEAGAEHVDERVVLIGLVEDHLATDGRDADGVAVARHAAHDALGDPPTPGVVERTEAERVHERNRAGAHGEDVAEDAADARRRTLVRLDRGRVVVALDAHRQRDAVTDVDHPGVLARTDHHPRCLGRESPEVDPRRFVGAVLRPHDRVHRELEVVGLTSEDRRDVGVLLVGQAKGPVDRDVWGVGHGPKLVAAPERLNR